MCQCDETIKTPFCGKGACVPPKQNVKPLIPWGGVTPLALLQQLTARFEQHREDGEECLLIAVRVFKNEAGNWVYQSYNSAGPAEVLYMACREMTLHITKDI